MTDADVARLDGVAQADLVRTGQLSPRELTDAALARIDALEPTLGALVHRFDDAARAASDGPLPDGPFRGVPFLLKDGVAHSAGDPFQVGMRFLRDRDWHEDTDSELVRRIRAAGFVIVGKTKLPELAAISTTEPLAHGPTHNPWALDRSPSGSSGGSAAAVAAGYVPIAHGNDMGGSIRTPAGACGLVGLKPTRARGSLAPAFGEYWGPLTHEGGLTRSVRDTAAFLDAIAGPATGDPYSAPPLLRPLAAEVGADPGRLRIGIRAVLPETIATLASQDCLVGTERTAELLEDLGHTVEALGPDALDESLEHILVSLFPAFIARDVDRWATRAGVDRDAVVATLEPTNLMMDEMGRAVPATQYLEALDQASRWARRVAGWWDEGWDLLLTPTSPAPPTPLGADPFAVLTTAPAFALPFNLTGQPAISLPLHWTDDGLPVGLQLVAAAGREDLLVRVASQLEEARPWADRWPPHNSLGMGAPAGANR